MGETLTTAVVLAAGAGKRLGALGRRYSKPMLPIAGRPLIAWVTDRLQAAGIRRLIVVGHADDAALADFLRAQAPEAVLVTQAERRGIGDALRLALPLVSGEPGCLACACDSLFVPVDIARVVALGSAAWGTAVVGVLDMGIEATAARSTVRLDTADPERVVEIIEKPAPGSHTWPLVGVPLYWVPPSMAAALRSAPAVGGEQHVSTALNAFITAGGTVRAVRVSERIEITTAADVARVEAAWRWPPAP